MPAAYHHNDYSPGFDKNRSSRIDSLFFNPDGTIRKVQPTLRGVGLTDAKQKIQPDRYSRLSATGVSVGFLDTLAKFQGWKTVFRGNQGWIQYNGVAFGKQRLKTVTIRAASVAGATLQIRLDAANGPVLAEVVIPKGAGWHEVSAISESVYRPVSSANYNRRSTKLKFALLYANSETAVKPP